MTPRQRGAGLEADLERFHATLPDWLVVKQNPRAEQFGRTVRFTGDGAPDYFGAHREHGGILFDAKATEHPRWTVCKDIGKRGGKPEYLGLQPHQHAAMRRMVATGQRAGVYCRLPSGDVWFPFAVVSPAWSAWWQDRKPRTLGPGDGIALSGCDWRVVL